MNIGIIGFGHITEHHFTAAKVTGAFAITAICDTDSGVLKSAPQGLACYTDLQQFLKDPGIEAVLIATPTATHFNLAKRVIQAGKPVLVEKPTTTTLREFNELEAQSKQAQVPVICMFHYAPASEVVAAYPYLRSKGETHHAAFHATFYDPYNTNFDLENFSLMNSWIDHGINQLSVFFSIWPDAQLQLTHFVLTPPKGPQLSTVSHSAEFTFTAGPISGMVILESNWSVGLNYKTTRIHISNPNHLVELEHMKESVLIDGKNVEGLSFANDYPRLTNHYIQLFPKAVALIKEGKSNWEFARRVHEPLFQVLEQALG